MKKLLPLLLAFVLAAVLCGCEKRLEPMHLRTAQLGEEARQMLDLTDNELTLWDYRTDGGSYDITMNFWVCRDGSWEKAQFFPGAAAAEGRFGVRVTSTKVEYIALEEDDTSRYSTNCPVDVTNKSGVCSYSALAGESGIVPGVEIPLLARLGWDESTDPVPADWENFQDSGCDVGVAITVTFTESAES